MANTPPNVTNDSIKPKEKLKLKPILLRYFKTSSIRGFPKIVTSESLILRIAWAIAIVSLLCISGFTVLKVIRNYSDQNVVLKFRTLNGEENLFPIVSVCDTMPFAPHVMDQIINGHIPGILTPKQYRTWLLEQVNFTKLRIPVSHLANLISYFEHIGYTHHHSLKPHNSDMILSCFYTIEGYDGIETNDSKCRIEIIYLSPFFSCYRIHAAHSLQKHERFLRVQFYVKKEPVNRMQCEHCIIEAKETLYDGVFFNLQNPLPVLDTNSATVFQTGTNVRLHITPERYVKSEANHRCLDNSKESLTYYDLTSKITVPYNSRLCWYFQLVKLMIEKCNCLLESFPSYISPSDRRKYPRCLNVMMYNETSKSHYLGSFKYLNCLSKLGVDKFFFTEDGYPKSPPHSSKECLPECSTVRYKKEVYQNPIISKASYLEIYRDSFRANSIYAPLISRNEDYDRAMKLLDQNRTEEARRIVENSAYRPLENFIFLQIERSNEPDIEYREDFVMDVYDTISQIGGALSVWSGVTVVCIFEILEFYFWIMQYVFIRTVRSHGR